MAQLKTRETRNSGAAFVRSIEDPLRRAECGALLRMVNEVTGKPPRMWGESIVGFGRYHYRYASGREGDWFVTGFSPRKKDLTVYVMPGFSRYDDLMRRVGRYRTGKSCLYLRRLEDVDESVLRELVARSVADMQEMYECS